MTENDDGFVRWGVSLDRLHFSATKFTDPDASQSEVEEAARQELIEALKTGEVTPRWKTTAQTREDIHGEALYTYSQACTRCKQYTEQEKREIVVKDTIQFVCPECADELRYICNECDRHRDELDGDESMEVTGNTVVEYLCSTCKAEADSDTQQPATS